MSDLIKLLRNSNDDIDLAAADALEAKDSKIEELESYLDEEREKNEKQVRMTMDLRADFESASVECNKAYRRIEALEQDDE